MYKAYFLLYTDAKETGYPENTWHFRFRHYKNKKKEKADTIRKKECVLMKKRYGIGFLIGMIVFTLVLVCAYQLSYDRAMRKLEAKQKSIQKKQENVIETKGSAQKEEGYFIKEKDGYIIVYLSDEKTVYEYTDIKVEILPEEIQKKIKSGNYITDIQQLYNFLENYSS